MYRIKWRCKDTWVVQTGLNRYKTMEAALKQVAWFKQIFPRNEYRIESDQEMYESEWNRSMAI